MEWDEVDGIKIGLDVRGLDLRGWGVMKWDGMKIG
jgi:hypothetical protein